MTRYSSWIELVNLKLKNATLGAILTCLFLKTAKNFNLMDMSRGSLLNPEIKTLLIACLKERSSSFVPLKCLNVVQ